MTYPDTAEFAAAVQPAYDRIADYIGENGQEYIDTFLKMVDDWPQQLFQVTQTH